MPLTVDCKTHEIIELQEFVDRLYENKVDPSDQESLLAAAPDLKALSNNKHFLGQYIANEIKNYSEFQKDNTYSSQVILLHAPSEGSKFFVRANVWPSKKDYLTLINGEDAFFYHKPHDHNFNFLTVGYIGSGYWSDYYEYDYDKVIGYPGESVNLKFVERSNLQEGKVMLYRAHLDVHDQLPADEYSISLNIMENSISNPMLDQYSFDTENRKIKSIINNNGTKALFDVAVIAGDDSSYDVVDHIANNHLIERVRLNAIDAMSKKQDTLEDIIGHYERYARDRSVFVQKNIKTRLLKLESLA
ncbi:transposase [Alteromonas halophila]|uniref:Uncharacterized protein n=1 Tax=Alteromonas halophila TaxID=516698 RepID=A0A918JJB5_9ALTE|nr:transposase [Alteromonas halophila]GGW83906.1 hypothetical protein GCM10007391_16900 [Alteromonas halophila]